VSELRNLPAVDALLQTRAAVELVARFGRPLTVDAMRTVLSEVRAGYSSGGKLPETSELMSLITSRLVYWLKPSLSYVINASGVVLHTNLGRAPLSKAALFAMQEVAGGYSTLEFDLEKGGRGSRSIHAEALLTRLTGAEAAIVVNNNAAAVLLALSALAKHKRVIVSRSQLVEIGGGFRIPDVMLQSGAKLVEVGTTNRVHAADFEEALQKPTALVVRAHPSNFRIIGFTTEPELAELVEIAHRQNVPVLDDLGSGTFIDTARFGLAHEPTILESVQAGADVICFSGDKLLGGPQAGILIGQKDLIARIKKHPLARAVRADKLCLAALTATLLHYLKDEAEREIPVWQMIGRTEEQNRVRAESWRDALDTGEVMAGFSTIGGGSLPEETLPTSLLALRVPQPNKFLEKLRRASPPVIARVEDDFVVFDPRTVFEEQDGALLVGIRQALGSS
jgi:L-seryl-tRNA(Ser) seleniumtransferase